MSYEETANEELLGLDTTHVAYADETHHNTGRYRGVALITLDANKAGYVTDCLRTILFKSSIEEFKWAKLKSARYRFAAQKIVDIVLEWLIQDSMRIDVLSWDIEDSRHKIHNRSDIRNLRRMYYFLFNPSCDLRKFRDSKRKLAQAKQLILEASTNKMTFSSKPFSVTA